MVDRERVKQLMLEIAERFGFDLHDDDELMDLWKVLLDDHPDLSSLYWDEVFGLRDAIVNEIENIKEL